MRLSYTDEDTTLGLRLVAEEQALVRKARSNEEVLRNKRLEIGDLLLRIAPARHEGPLTQIQAVMRAFCPAINLTFDTGREYRRVSAYTPLDIRDRIAASPVIVTYEAMRAAVTADGSRWDALFEAIKTAQSDGQIRLTRASMREAFGLKPSNPAPPTAKDTATTPKTAVKLVYPSGDGRVDLITNLRQDPGLMSAVVDLIAADQEACLQIVPSVVSTTAGRAAIAAHGYHQEGRHLRTAPLLSNEAERSRELSYRLVATLKALREIGGELQQGAALPEHTQHLMSRVCTDIRTQAEWIEQLSTTGGITDESLQRLIGGE